MQDRRLHTRYPVKLEGKAFSKLGYAFCVETLDISIGGAKLKISSNYPFSIGDVLDLKIRWKIPITFSAEIRWVNTDPPFTYMGIKFQNMSMADYQTLCALLTELGLSFSPEVSTR